MVFWLQFHSHQIFHCFVIAGAFVHYHGISLMSLYRLKVGECPVPALAQSHCLLLNGSGSLRGEVGEI